MAYVWRGHCRLGQQARQERHVPVVHGRLHPLSTCDASIGVVGEHGRDEQWRVVDEVRGIVGAVENVVHENRHDQARVGGVDAAVASKLVDGIVVRRKQRNILRVREGRDKIGIAGQERI
jgi:hypothetical protein